MMWVLHLINKIDPKTNRPMGLYGVKNEKNHYYSWCWDFDPNKAKELIGGMIYLHEKKSSKSFFGGKVLEILPADLDSPPDFVIINEKDEAKKRQRIMFKVESIPEGKNQEWRGRDHSMSWTSGIIEI